MTSAPAKKTKPKLVLKIPNVKPPDVLSSFMNRGISRDKIIVLESIGKGAFSTVFKIQNKDTGEICAMKIIKFSEKPETLQAIVNEIYCLNTFRHKNLLQLYNVFYDQTNICIIMPLVTGLSLTEALKVMTTVPEPILGRMLYYCVQGLVYFKKQCFIHRDLKPSNIMLSIDGNVLITDFGMARQLTASHDKAESYNGTISYMSPERVRSDKYSYNSDVWSLGLIFYQCALGHFPLKLDPATLTYWDILNFVQQEIKIELPEGYDPGFGDFLGHCLVLVPEERSEIEVLEQHPWLKKYESPSYDAGLKEWINTAYNKLNELKRKNVSILKDLN